MRLRELALSLSSDERLPRYRRVAMAIQDAIQKGRLQPGESLPGTRALADQLGVNRATVIQAIEELEAEGWLVTEPNRGTFVERRLPEPMGDGDILAGTSQPPEPGFDLPSRLKPLTVAGDDLIDLSDGLPDTTLAPLEELGRAYQRALLRHGDDLLRHGEPMGQGLLRTQVAAWLSERRGLRVAPDQILITRGSRAAFQLLAQSFCSPGDALAVENPGNRAVWDAFMQGCPVSLVPVPVDAEGADPEAMASLLEQKRCRAIYVTPQRQYPTTVALTPQRRRRLLELAAQHRIPIFEDDHDSDYTFGDRPLLPLASQDERGQVIYTTNLGRILAPGIRLACIVGPVQVMDRLARVQRNMDAQGDRVVEWAAADLIRDGDMARHLRKARRIYEDRMRFLAARLRAAFGDSLEVVEPTGGLALWLRIGPGIDPEAWMDAARIRGLVLQRPQHFYLGEPGPFTRMGFAQGDQNVLDEASSRLAAALADLKGP